MPIRVLLADDQQLVRRGFRMILRAEPDIEVVGEAADGREAVAAAELQPDVVLMDIRMPEFDGLEATRRLMNGDEPRPRVGVLTTFSLDEYVYEALRAGVSSFLLKDAREEQLIGAIRLAAEGGAMFAPAVTKTLIEEFAQHTPSPAAPALDELTERETEVLRLLARALEPRAGRSSGRIGAHGEDARDKDLDEARPARAHAGRDPGLRIGPGAR